MTRLAVVAILSLCLAAVAGWVLSSPTKIDKETAAEMAIPGEPVAGRILFFAGGCDSCHMSQGQSDPLKLGGGLALKTPFGTFYPPNISPDASDGIGRWTAVAFADALLKGVSPDGAHYYPAFPYASYRLMKPKDLRDLFAFIETLPPVAGRAPTTTLAFPFDIRRGVGLWKLWYLRGGELPAETDRGPSWMLGRYLVEGPGHCGECHSPRDLFGGVIASKRLSGAPILDGKGKAPDITTHGLKDWSKADIIEALSSGFTPNGDTLGGAMAAVVRNTAELPKSYRQAIAEYLKDDSN